MSDTRIITTNDTNHKIVRVNNFLISYGINGSGFFDTNEVNREPTIDEYHELWDTTDLYLEQYFTELSTKNNNNNNNNNTMNGTNGNGGCSHSKKSNFVKFQRTIQSASYCTDNIPNESYQICIKYSYSDMYYTNNSQLTDEMEVMAEGIIAKAVGRKKYIETLRQIGNGETVFKAVESIYFQYYGSNGFP